MPDHGEILKCVTRVFVARDSSFDVNRLKHNPLSIELQLIRQDKIKPMGHVLYPTTLVVDTDRLYVKLGAYSQAPYSSYVCGNFQTLAELEVILTNLFQDDPVSLRTKLTCIETIRRIDTSLSRYITH